MFQSDKITESRKSEMFSEEELWELTCLAHEWYHDRFVGKKQIYRRFVKDFINYHLYCTFEKEKEIRSHIMNVLAIHELLEERKDLVEKFIAKKEFTRDDFSEMIYQFNTTEYCIHKDDIQATKETLGKFSPRQISLLTRQMNENGLFTEELSEENTEKFFSCVRPLKATNNGKAGLYLSQLCSNGLICYSWQKLLEDKALLISSNNGFIKRKTLRTEIFSFAKHNENLRKAFGKQARDVKEIE